MASEPKDPGFPPGPRERPKAASAPSNGNL